jgi:hypothetical protein
MVKVALKNWKPGLRTVTLITLIKNAAGLPLGKSKEVVERLLDRELVYVDLEEERAVEFVSQLEKLGVDAQISE